MKKYIVLKDFIDKNTKKLYKVGDEIELTDDRCDEILSKGKYIKAKIIRKSKKKEGEV